MTKPMERVSLDWTGTGLEFIGRRDGMDTRIDGQGVAGPNPVALLLEAAAACMAIDVVDILEKGRQELAGLRVEVEAIRMDEPPRYVRWIRLLFDIRGPVDEAKARRAITLSFDKYCSVFHSLRKDLEYEWDVRLSG